MNPPVNVRSRRPQHYSVSLCLGFLLILVAAGLNATTIHVPYEQPTIPAAFSAAANGDTVLVAPGTYSFNLDFDGKSVRIASSHGPDVTFLRQAVSSQPLFTMNQQETSDAQICGFTIASAYGPHAIIIEVGATPLISGNIFHHFQGNGSNATVIRCSNADPLITHNVFYDNLGISCIGIWDGTVRIINNTFDHNARGFFTLGYQGTILNNIVSNSTNYGIHGRYTTLDYNDVWSNGINYQGDAVPGPGSMQVDPQFEDVAGRKYNLQHDSPCIDAGHPDPQYNDADGSRNDMGAQSLVIGNPPIARQVFFSPSRTPGVVYSATPSFHWQYRDVTPSSQTGYEVEVGTDPTWVASPLWQTGQVSSPDTTINYTGQPLDDHAAYYLRIRLANATQWGDWMVFAFRVHILGAARVPSEFASIQQAIEAVADHDTVLVEDGTYNVTLDFKGRQVVLKSVSGPVTTRLRPNFVASPVVLFGSGETRDAILDGFTVTGTSQTCLIQVRNAGPTIQNCLIADFTNTLGSAALMTRSGDPMILRNKFVACGGNGAIIVESGQCTVINNTFDDNSRAMNSSGSTLAINNIITNSSTTGIGGTYARQEYNNIWNNTVDYWNGALPGNGNLSLDPLYSNKALRDYRLQINSPCINAGDPDPSYIDQDGSRNDMGALTLVLDSLPRAVRTAISPKSSSGNVVSLLPLFSWQYLGLYGTQQQAVEVEVGTNNNWSVAETWQSGVVYSDSMRIAFGGAPLVNNTVYYVRLRLSDGSSWGAWTFFNFRVRLPRAINVPAQFGTINAAISAAQTDDTILVAPGTYGTSTAIDFQGKGVKVLSSGGPQATFLRAPLETSTVLFTRNETRASVISGFTFEGGSYSAISLFGDAEPTITNNVFRNSQCWNTVENNSTRSPLLANCIFYHNTGGRSVVDDNGSMQVVNNTFDLNYAAIYSSTGRTVAINNVIMRSTEYGIAGYFARQEYNLLWQNQINYNSGTVPGTGNLSVDPLFICGDGQEYQLSFESPCINAGAPDLALVDPDSSRSDIGAKAFLSTSAVQFRHLTIESENLNRVVSQTPRFVWGQHSYLGDASYGYRIQVGTDANWTVAEMWSKEVNERTDTFVVYGGAPLIAGRTYWMRIQVTDGAEWSDWRQLWFRTNNPPIAPVLRSPLNYVVTTEIPWLTAKVKGDPDYDETTIDFVFCTDSLLTDQVLLVEDAPVDTWDSIAYCKPVITIAENAGLFWSTRASDGNQYSAWSTPTRLWVSREPEAPGPFALREPLPHIVQSLSTLVPRFSWTRSSDPDPGDTLYYSLELAVDPLFEYVYAKDSLLDTTCVLSFPLQVSRQYWWRVKVTDPTSRIVVSDTGSFWTWKQGDIDLSRAIDLHDLSMMISYLVAGLDIEVPRHVGDCSGDCLVDLTDLSQLIAYMSGLQIRFGAPCIDSASGQFLRHSTPWPDLIESEESSGISTDTALNGGQTEPAEQRIMPCLPGTGVGTELMRRRPVQGPHR